MFYRFFRGLFLLILKLFFRFRVEGRENLPKIGGFIVASNHVSYLDPAALGCACPRTLSYMARDNLFAAPVLGPWMRLVGVIPVKRKAADFSAMKEAIRRVSEGRVLGIFPEGTRQLPGVILENPEPGIGFLASKLDVPVIPAFIRGTDKAWPRNAKHMRLALIEVHFGKALKTDEKMPYEEIAKVIMKDIRHLAF